MKKQIPHGELDRNYMLTGYTLENVDYTEFDTEKEAKAAMKKVENYLNGRHLKCD
jgi:hypothetical protein